MNYIHFNPVRHGYVEDPEKWRFGSYGEWHRDASSKIEAVERDHPYDRVHVEDDF